MTCDIAVMYEIIADMKSELANVGFALRWHNAKYPDDRDKQIIIQDVVRDWIEFKYDLTIERAAAVTHFSDHHHASNISAVMGESLGSI